MKNTHGFSLLEVLLASVLLAGGLLLAFASLRSVIDAQARSERVIGETERSRAVQAFLRRQIGAALPIAFEIIPETGEGRLMQVDARRLRFVGEMPGYLSRGGLYLQTFEWVGGAGGMRLQFQAEQLTPEGALEAERPPQVLIDGLRSGSFEVRSLDTRGEWTAWETDWKRTLLMPALLRVRAQPQRDASAWPDLIIAPRLNQTGPSATSDELVPIEHQPRQPVERLD